MISMIEIWCNDYKFKQKESKQLHACMENMFPWTKLPIQDPIAFVELLHPAFHRSTL